MSKRTLIFFAIAALAVGLAIWLSLKTFSKTKTPFQQEGMSMQMPYVGLKESKAKDNYEIVLSPTRRQMIGVRTGQVIQAPMQLTVRAFGNISYDEPLLTDVTLRVRGWITDLIANYRGERVNKGQPLFTLYSPELLAAQKEYLQILKRENDEGPFSRISSIAEAARERLSLWNITDEQIRVLQKTRIPFESMPFLSPVDGYIIEKNVVEGDIVEAGMKIFRIVPIDKVWLKAEIYQSDLLQIHPGQEATITLPYIPGKTYKGKVSYIYPYLEGNAFTGWALIQLDNPLEKLLLNMYANIDLHIPLGQRVQIPESAVIYIGNDRIVFLDLGEGRMRPKKVQVGLRSNGYYEVISGLQVGDVVVTSGNFLIASESNILSAMKYWEDHGPDGKK